MAQPVIVRAYTSPRTTPSDTSTFRGRNKKPKASFPAISSFAFADVFKTVDSPELQAAINGIVEIAANNRMALADEYSSHLPPLGEITAASAVPGRSAVVRPRALTTVEEASTSGSEGSGRRKSRQSIVGFWESQNVETMAVRRVRIGNMGRKAATVGTTAITKPREEQMANIMDQNSPLTAQDLDFSSARLNLQRLLALRSNNQLN